MTKFSGKGVCMCVVLVQCGHAKKPRARGGTQWGLTLDFIVMLAKQQGEGLDPEGVLPLPFACLPCLCDITETLPPPQNLILWLCSEREQDQGTPRGFQRHL